MSRYIDAELAKETIREYLKTEAPMPRICKKVMDIAIGAVDLTPTADVVEVVRCKDCKHCKKDSHWKELYCLKMSDDEHTHWLDKDFYCGYGERRTDDEG